jgi:hypothetical protein
MRFGESPKYSCATAEDNARLINLIDSKLAATATATHYYFLASDSRMRAECFLVHV